jgi:hypothetical protein
MALTMRPTGLHSQIDIDKGIRITASLAASFGLGVNDPSPSASANGNFNLIMDAMVPRRQLPTLNPATVTKPRPANVSQSIQPSTRSL